MARVLNGVETLPKFNWLSRVHERYRQTDDDRRIAIVYTRT